MLSDILKDCDDFPTEDFVTNQSDFVVWLQIRMRREEETTPAHLGANTDGRLIRNLLSQFTHGSSMDIDLKKMSHSYHVTDRNIRRDDRLNRDDDGYEQLALSKLQELSLKKWCAKNTEIWRRAAVKQGTLRHFVFGFKDGKPADRVQKLRGILSEIPGTES